MIKRLPVDLGLVLVAGLAIALSGGTVALAAPLAAASPPGVVLGGLSLPVGVYSGPSRCIDVTTPASHISVGAASAPHCVVIMTGAVGGASLPRPVGAASGPRCVVVTTPATSYRTC